MFVVTDLDDAFVPQPDDLLANLAESRTIIDNLLDRLPEIFKSTQIAANALGAALQVGQKMVVRILTFPFPFPFSFFYFF